MQKLLTALHTAGIRSITLDPVAGKIRWVATQPVPAALRARVAIVKPTLLALAGTRSLTITPDDLAASIASPLPPGLPDGYTLTVPDNWTRPGYRLDGPDGFWTIATSYERGVAMARLHARAARLRTVEGGAG